MAGGATPPLRLPHGNQKAFPFRGVERPENSSVNCFQRDRDGSPVERWPSEARSEEAASLPCLPLHRGGNEERSSGG